MRKLHAMMNCPEMKALEKWILWQFLATEEGESLNLSQIKKRCADTEDAVTKAVKSLQQKGYLSCEKVRIGGKWNYTYKASWTPIK